MDARYVQRGDAIDHTPMGDIPAGELLCPGKLVCVAKLDMKADEFGAFALTGVYELPKAPGVALAQGEIVGWNAATKSFIARWLDETVASGLPHLELDNTWGPG